MPNAALQRFRQILTGQPAETPKDEPGTKVVDSTEGEGPGISLADAAGIPDEFQRKVPSPEESTGQAEAHAAPEASQDQETATEARLKEHAQRADRLERELEFLRRGQQPAQPAQPQVDPVQQAMDMLRVDPETWTKMLTDPEAGSMHATNALQAAFVLAQRVAEERLGKRFSEELNNRFAQAQQERRGERLNEAFWSQNPELGEYLPVVQHFALQVSKESEDDPGGGFRGEDAINEISRRARAQLQSWGVSLEAKSKGTRRGNLRPASGDMGGGTGAPAPAITEQQKQMLRVLGRRAS